MTIEGFYEARQEDSQREKERPRKLSERRPFFKTKSERKKEFKFQEAYTETKNGEILLIDHSGGRSKTLDLTW